ncbi:hypothetical protein DBB42_27540 [Pseudomonas plecoglossicida]|uniref:Uncharacterized protein n=1 Tax=Pseudomonas plecoglossicida TaxID=70775 RepID=A0A2R7UC85_PSEDL|nr:DUF6555 family protein [Pseudomonas plecoglossicida]PTU49055.1 hypothetical protein DBB42_27540 [Pseudomonas plecoglossicida]
MSDPIYVIEYSLHNTARSFMIRHPKMTNEEAWHWASCDAGVGIIPRFGSDKKIKKVSRPLAERYGITNVRWRRSF